MIPANDTRLQRCGFAKLVGPGIDYLFRKYEVMLGRACKTGQADVVMGENMSLSRQHAKIAYNFETNVWELHILGKNGVTIAGVLYGPESPPRPLRSQEQLMIGDRYVYFLLPKQPGGTPPRPQPQALSPTAAKRAAPALDNPAAAKLPRIAPQVPAGAVVGAGSLPMAVHMPGQAPVGQPGVGVLHAPGMAVSQQQQQQVSRQAQLQQMAQQQLQHQLQLQLQAQATQQHPLGQQQSQPHQGLHLNLGLPTTPAPPQAPGGGSGGGAAGGGGTHTNTAGGGLMPGSALPTGGGLSLTGGLGEDGLEGGSLLRGAHEASPSLQALSPLPPLDLGGGPGGLDDDGGLGGPSLLTPNGGLGDLGDL